MANGQPRTLVLALNAGSSSLKASVVADGEGTLISFLAERLMTIDSVIHVSGRRAPGRDLEKEPGSILSHSEALTKIIEYLERQGMLANLLAVGHRVVHGGTIFPESAIIGPKEMEEMASISHLAPLHNPHNLAGIEAVSTILPGTPNVAVFDTSFHSSIPAKAHTYPLPAEYRAKDMRKFGFHGTSVKYCSQKASAILYSMKCIGGHPEPFQMIVSHLGNGASVTAVSGDKSVETSMGFTPLSGLMMGTRCGDVDPSVVAFACNQLNKNVDQVLNDLNKNSGLKGMTGDGQNDMRELIARSNKHDKEAELAIEMFVYRLAQHIAQSLVALERPVDALIFTAGIGEHSHEIRQRAVQELSKVIPSLELDDERNLANGMQSKGIISKEGTWPAVLVIATDEEAMIAKECIQLVKAHHFSNHAKPL